MWIPLSPVWTKRATKDLNKMPPAVRAQVEGAVNRYAATGVGDIKAMKGQPGAFRLRTGDYRCVFLVVIIEERMHVLKVGHRRDIYD